MNKKVSFTRSSQFYKEFRETDPYMVMGMIIITFGLYIINWIFLRNKEFQILDDFAPDPNRGAVIMMILPFMLFFILQIFKKLFFKGENLILLLFEVISWTIVIILILKYLLDFCFCFARITRTSGWFWFSMYFLGFIGIMGIVFKWYYAIPLVFFTIIVVPSMQAEVNVFFKRFTMKKEKALYYDT